jgi:predicted DNA-binding transcriptional regulator AlpA
MSPTEQTGRRPGGMRIPTPQEIAAAADPDALLDIAVVCALTSMKKTYITTEVRNWRFPQPIHLSRRVTRWRAGDVRAWLKERADRLKLHGPTA